MIVIRALRILYYYVGTMINVVAVVLLFVAHEVSAQGYLPPTIPPWPPTYSMQLSSLTMQCNVSLSEPSRQTMHRASFAE